MRFEGLILESCFTPAYHWINGATWYDRVPLSIILLRFADKGVPVTIDVTPTDLNFSPMHERIQSYVDAGVIPFATTLVLQGDQVVDLQFYQGTEAASPLTEHKIFRMHSSTKMVTSVAAMMLFEEGRFRLDDPLESYLPAFADMQVLKVDATSIGDTEPAQGPIRINQILSHTAGLSYSFIEPDSVIDRAYTHAGLNPLTRTEGLTLESLCTRLGSLPLAYQPGTFWRYSLATDVTARLIEVLSGQRFDEFLKARIFEPLGMHDTDFHIPEDKLDRLTTMYLPDDPMDPMSPCPRPGDRPSKTVHGTRPTFLSGGGGLLSTLVDYLAFTRMIINGGSYGSAQLLKPETLKLMRTNQCAQGVIVNFPMWRMPSTTFGLGFALKEAPAPGEPPTAVGEYHWGGMAGTHFWWSPEADITGICMTQRMPGFWHPFSHEFKRWTYEIAGR